MTYYGNLKLKVIILFEKINPVFFLLSEDTSVTVHSILIEPKCDHSKPRREINGSGETGLPFFVATPVIIA